jgi:NADH dehydrogenase
VFAAFEAAERETDPERKRRLLNFVIVGAGPTGVELAGALAEIARHSLKREYRRIRPADARIVLVEAGGRVLPSYPPSLSETARESLERLGVTVRTGTMVAAVAGDHVVLDSGRAAEQMATQTVLWAAGVQASPLAKRLADATGATLDRAGRITVERDLSLPGQPGVFVLGDMASYAHQTGVPLPGVAPVAVQQGRFVARLIDARLHGRPLPAFRYRNLGSLATIGRSAAVADLGRLRFGGAVAWILWLFIHLMNLVSFRNRVLVLVQWAWSYITYDRSARLITETRCE